MDGLGGLESLFENLPNVSFWVKDLEGRFVMGNQQVVRMCGLREESELIGKTDFDFFPKHVAEHFRRDDLNVIHTKKKTVDRIEPISNDDGSLSWYTTNKVPVHGKDGKIIGVAGTTRHLNKGPGPQPYMEFSAVMEFITKNYAQSIEIGQLAKIAALSVSQFERRFQRIFQESPSQFIIKVRINAACKELVNNHNLIGWVANASGFSDQSYFSKQFVKFMGITPRQYREKYFQGQS